MNYLITCAGRGSRFLKDGIKPPKPLIKVLGNELLIWSLNSFKFNFEDNLFIVSLFKDQVKLKIEKKLKIIFPYISINWLEIDKLLPGQLITSIEAIKTFNIKGPLIIHNCDTYYSFNIDEINKFLYKDIFGIIPSFKANGNHWSFVKTSESDFNQVISVSEKKRISDNCSVGTYIFSDTEIFLNLSNKYLEKQNSNKFSENFIAPIFQFALENDFKVKTITAENVKVFGTPEELLSNFQITRNELIGENAWNANHKKTLVIDIDKTICDKKDFQDYSQCSPLDDVCDVIRRADKEGVYIILFTSRNMRTFKGSLGLINKITAPLLINWLSENNIPYDEIYFGKPWGNSVNYVDDRNYLIDDFLKTYLD